MFIPKTYQETNRKEIYRFIEENAFGTIVSLQNGRPVASHIPFNVVKEDEAYYLTGHVAAVNTQWKTLEESEVLVMFQGPHAYVSASWYNHENVSTWNYQAVHIYGTATLMETEEVVEDLQQLMQKYEQTRDNAVLWENLSQQTKKQLHGIVGFKIKVEEVQAAYKLSQNRNDEDYANIIEQLEKEDDAGAKQIATAMKKIRPL